MSMSSLFNQFNSNICLTKSKRDKLARNRQALRDRIRRYFSSQGWEVPKFYSQGSFMLQTNLNPIKTQLNGRIQEEYDLDDGVYFFCNIEERLVPDTYHRRLVEAVTGHTETTQDKATCVRVKYMDGHHIDLPCYWRSGDNTPLLAHKSGYIESDPRAFKDWVDKKISYTNQTGYLRRIIRFLKAWKNFRESQNSSLRMPSGFILTILACNHFREHQDIDVALTNTVKAINSNLNWSFRCYRPTTPTNEDLLTGYSETNVKNEFAKFVTLADQALNAETEKEASEYWQCLFGDRFPSGQDDGGDKAGAVAGSIITGAKPLWSID